MEAFPLQRLYARLWWGPFRRPFEAVARCSVAPRSSVLSGPLRGAMFNGGLAQTLGVYEIRVQQALRALLRPGDRFFDIGAHSGFFTLLGSRLVGEGGMVVACEPNPSVIPLLQANLERNDTSNVIVIEVAVTGQPGRFGFVSDPSRPTPEAHLAGENTASSLSVEGVTLDSLVHRYGAPSVVKIDVEGHAGEVLSGAPAVLQNEDGPTFLVEVHSAGEEKSCRLMLGARAIETLAPRRHLDSGFPRHIVAYYGDRRPLNRKDRRWE